MMIYVMNASNGFVDAVGTTENDSINEITEQKYNEIISLLQNRPIPPSGYDFRLRADDLEWELVELPPPDPDPELDDAEALEILFGGGGV